MGSSHVEMTSYEISQNKEMTEQGLTKLGICLCVLCFRGNPLWLPVFVVGVNPCSWVWFYSLLLYVVLFLMSLMSLYSVNPCTFVLRSQLQSCVAT